MGWPTGLVGLRPNTLHSRCCAPFSALRAPSNPLAGVRCRPAASELVPSLLNGAANGTRTRDPKIHNLVL